MPRFFKRAAVIATSVALAVSFNVTGAGHDGNDEAWRKAMLDSCVWDESSTRTITYNGETLHDEPFAVRNLFYIVWGEGNPDGVKHLARWVFERECLHPDPDLHDHGVFAHSHRNEGAHDHHPKRTPVPMSKVW